MSFNFSIDWVDFEGRRLYGAFAELGNAIIALFWEGEEPRLGTLTVTLPNRVSSTLLGDRDHLLSQLLGEQLASIHSKMALVSINLSLSTARAAGKTLLDLARRLKGEGGRDPMEAGP